jgi:hypothetical protein
VAVYGEFHMAAVTVLRFFHLVRLHSGSLSTSVDLGGVPELPGLATLLSAAGPARHGEGMAQGDIALQLPGQMFPVGTAKSGHLSRKVSTSLEQ